MSESKDKSVKEVNQPSTFELMQKAMISAQKKAIAEDKLYGWGPAVIQPRKKKRVERVSKKKVS